MSVALLFPGQGAQRTGMLRSLPESPATRGVVAEAVQVCRELGVAGDLDDPGRDTVRTQLGLVVTGVACGRALLDDHGVTAEFAAGHSVGAFAAAVVAGVLTLRDALGAVELRARSMRAACAGRDWGMAAISGAPTRAVRGIVDEISTPAEPMWIANVNSAIQTVVGGTAPALALAENAARRAGARSFERLAMEVASHGVVQVSTARALADHLAGLDTHAPTIAYITDTGGRAVRAERAVLDDLAQSVATTVRWYDGVRLMAELGVTCTVETAPGHTLSRLVTASAPTVTAVSVDDGGLGAAAARASARG